VVEAILFSRSPGNGIPRGSDTNPATDLLEKEAGYLEAQASYVLGKTSDGTSG
jgi:hypothetical protein